MISQCQSGSCRRITRTCDGSNRRPQPRTLGCRLFRSARSHAAPPALVLIEICYSRPRHEGLLQGSRGREGRNGGGNQGRLPEARQGESPGSSPGGQEGGGPFQGSQRSVWSRRRCGGEGRI